MAGIDTVSSTYVLARRSELLRRGGAEALGAFALVFAGCGAIITDAHTHGALVYVAGQLIGAIAAALLLWAIWPSQPADLGATVPSIAAGRALIMEVVMSALLMMVILSVATDTRAIGAPAALAIGATIALDALFGGPLTGASMNPARSFAPAVVSGQWHDFWVYIAGPLIGAPLGALAYQLVRGEHPGMAGVDPAPEEV
jgi:glycerol uptake facilitator-like aquaporin